MHWKVYILILCSFIPLVCLASHQRNVIGHVHTSQRPFNRNLTNGLATRIFHNSKGRRIQEIDTGYRGENGRVAGSNVQDSVQAEDGGNGMEEDLKQNAVDEEYSEEGQEIGRVTRLNQENSDTLDERREVPFSVRESKDDHEILRQYEHLFDPNEVEENNIPADFSKTITKGNRPKKTNQDLPSFENAPIPEKKSFAQWKHEHASKKQANTPFELTSSLFLVPEILRYAQGKSYVAACLVARDEHDDINEWITHHLSLGVHPIYVYDHASIPRLHGILRRFIRYGSVVYQELDTADSGELTPQLYAYRLCLEDHGPDHQWLMFLDIDEFLIFRQGPSIQSLPALLYEYENFSALAVHWILFGSSGHDARPLKGVLRSYVRCMPLKHAQHLFVKTIVNTRCTVGPSDSPHSFTHNCSMPAVRTNFAPILGATASDMPVHDTLVVHHYAIKSLEDFEIKLLKGSGMRRQRGWEYFYFVDGWSTEFNFDALRAWDSDVHSKARALGPEHIQLQVAAYSKEALDNFWGSHMTQVEFEQTLQEEESGTQDQYTTEEEQLEDPYEAEDGDWPS